MNRLRPSRDQGRVEVGRVHAHPAEAAAGVTAPRPAVPLCVEEAFGQAARTVQRMLGLQQSVDSLEAMNVSMGDWDAVCARVTAELQG